MRIEICSVGGYNESGRNCTAVKVADEVIVFDLGLNLEPYIKYTEDEDVVKVGVAKLTEVDAVPTLKHIEDWTKKVKAIVIGHAHLDHVGAVPFLSNKFDAPIVCTPYTAEVLSAIVKDDKIRLKNPVKRLNPNSRFPVSDNLEIEFINVTHSVPQTVMIALHTPKGVILYANDFKFDISPILDKKPNYERLRELGKKGVLCLIIDSLYSSNPQKTPSETVARELLKEVMLGVDSLGKAVIITTFSSHIARLKSIVEFGKRMNRKIVFLGRSLAKYVKAAENIGLVKFSKDVEIVKYGKQIKKMLQKIQKKGKHKYLIVCTGHQGEPKAVLSKIATKKFPFKLDAEDHVIFSCKVIPTGTNEENRRKLEEQLKNRYKVRIFSDIHVSGHASREDQRDLINMTKPQHIIPSHGDYRLVSPLLELASEMGYSNVHLMKNGQRIRL
ncbi:RNase J family beta-CASP ribonuclease [Candidatus Woesearchaeota archaeon]|nr:MAG: RNase J family beta-CASP ribonuclease [Candidatus Woesearchaeota archaeon]